MYGLINRGLQQLVISKFGEAKWDAIRRDAHFEEKVFISIKPYHDDVTFRLLNAASKHTAIPVPDLLRTFGEYWIIHVNSEGYGAMMDSVGSGFVECLKGLNMMHFRLGNLLPEMAMPQFEVSDETPHSLLLHYKSKREGLADMVIGLMEGLAKKFNTECSIELVQSKATGADHDIFRITWK